MAITWEQFEQIRNRHAILVEFVGDRRGILEDLGRFAGIVPARRMAKIPVGGLEAVETALQGIAVPAPESEDWLWLVTRLAFLAGETLRDRLGGIWTVNAEPQSRSFLRFVIGELPAVPAGTTVDPFTIAEDRLHNTFGATLPGLVEMAVGEVERLKDTPPP